MNKEQQRIDSCTDNKTWKKWGPYLADRQWGTVREDYSENGDAWSFISHDKARSNAYRWGEEGIAGFCDNEQTICLAPAFWNGNDPILKERLFGLANTQGNHGEDVKELYYHVANTPTHTYCKFLYKYPHSKFPYSDLTNNAKRAKHEREYEIQETGAFDDNNYFDIEIEYAKVSQEDFFMVVTIHNRGENEARIDVLPTLWFRNYWKHRDGLEVPHLQQAGKQAVSVHTDRMMDHYLYYREGTSMFCDNVTNNKKVYGFDGGNQFPKDAINDEVLTGKSTTNPDKKGTKAAIHSSHQIAGGKSVQVAVRFTEQQWSNPWETFETTLSARRQECAQYYNSILGSTKDQEEKNIAEKALSGLLWTKQFYYYDVFRWTHGEDHETQRPRKPVRNQDWDHLSNKNIISMPDKWEYPWYAAWDLAFHTVSLVEVDPVFAKRQLTLMLREYYMHPNGQIPAYEWNFSDVNPPVHAWSVLEVFLRDQNLKSESDFNFLETCFHKLLMNFTWWVNRKDSTGKNVFEGGFLGFDNIGVFDRSHLPQDIASLEQADATSWMCMYSLNMLKIALLLSRNNPLYQESASKFLRHFLDIAHAAHHLGDEDLSLWNDEDNFYYDIARLQDGETKHVKIKSLVGIIPLFAVEIVPHSLFEDLVDFKRRTLALIDFRPDLAAMVSRFENTNPSGDHLFSMMRGYRLGHVLKSLFDPEQFLSEYGIRSLSKHHESEPFHMNIGGEEHRVSYEPGESQSDMFGGNSNWRGPIWFPINFMIIRSLRKYHKFYGSEFKMEFPTGSGEEFDLDTIANKLSDRLISMFKKDENGHYAYHDKYENCDSEIFADEHLFYEFFDAESGRGLGASHQTGWTALIANLIMEKTS